MKKSLVLMLAVILVASLFAGCGQGGGKTTTDAILYYACGSEPYLTLDPSVENSNGVCVLQNVYETLTRYNDQTGEVEPYLATSWTHNDDGTVWEFTLREDVSFHDGTKMNANAVKKSIDRTIKLGKGAAYIWTNVESVEVVSDYVVRFNCSEATSIDLIASAAYAAYIISEDACDKDGDWFNSEEGNDGGSGPYTVKSLVTGDQVLLSAYDGYWREWKENSYKMVVIKKHVESGTRRQLLETGEAQIAYNFSTTDIAALKSNENVEIKYVNTYNNILLFFNSEKQPCSNEEFRKALAYSFPYEEVINGVLENRGQLSHGLVTPGLWGHDENCTQYEFNLDKARECLEKSGIDVSSVKLEFSIQSGYTEYKDLAQLWQTYLKEIGITMEIRERGWDSHIEHARATRPEDRQDIFIMIWWPDYADPSSWFQSMVHSQETPAFNLSYIKNPEWDAKIEEAMRLTATDRAKAEELYKEVQKGVLDGAYMLPVYDQVITYAVSKDIDGFYYNPAYPNSTVYFDITHK